MTVSIGDIINKKEKIAEDNKDTKIQWGSYAILGILFMIITSDIFVDNVLSICKSSVDGRTLTFTGAIISAIILIMAHILIVTQLS